MNNFEAKAIADILGMFLDSNHELSKFNGKEKVPEIHGYLADLAYLDKFEDSALVRLALNFIDGLYNANDEQVEVALKFFYEALIRFEVDFTEK
jgi:hypothetical protein